MRTLLPTLLLLTGCPKNPGPQAPSMAPSSNVYLRNSFDTDPSGYIGRFLPAGLTDLDDLISQWPPNEHGRPRSATVIIQRRDRTDRRPVGM